MQTVKGSNRVAAPKVRKGRAGNFTIRVYNRDSLRELIAEVAVTGEVAMSVNLVIDRVGFSPLKSVGNRKHFRVAETSQKHFDI